MAQNDTKVYHILIKLNESYTVLVFPADSQNDALTFAQTKGEVVSILEVADNYTFDDLDYNAQMLDYYPAVIKAIREFQALIGVQSLQIENIHVELTKVFDNAFIGTADESTVSRWEQFLGITPPPQGTESAESWLTGRRETILAKLYTTQKLNSKSISDIVSIFTNGETTSYFKDGVVWVRISPHKKDTVIHFDNIINELRKRLPVHLGLNVTKNYFTWQEVSANNKTWADVQTNNTDWDDVLYHP